MNSLYIHIPFCNRICSYCDFNKFLIKNQPVDAYIDCLIQELDQIQDEQLNTVFIGGGTPTALNEKQLTKLLSYIQNKFKILTEFTIEANPDELTEQKIKLMKDFGVNRLSLGVQTFNDRLLNSLGRTHQESDIYSAVKSAKKFGIPSVSLDLMYHLPTQTLDEMKLDLMKAVQMDIDHISSYSLILEPKTQFYNMYRKGLLQMSDDNLAKSMYETTMQILNAHGFYQYEISNYAKPGHESLHNQVYWENKTYYGAGAGSHGYINGERYYNIGPVPHYIKAMQQQQNVVKERIPVDEMSSMEEFMFLGLRLNKGISIEVFNQRYQSSFDEVFGKVTNQLIKDQLIEIVNNHVRLTQQGRMIGNDVFEKYLLTI